MTQSDKQDTPSPGASGRYKTPPGMRNIRVVVDEKTFVHLHDMANKSRMRFQPYLRRFLQEAKSYETPSKQPGAVSFGTGHNLDNSPE